MLSVFKEVVPIGRSFQIRGQNFTVEGVFGQFDTSPLTPISNYNNAIFIPYAIGQQMSSNQLQLYEVFAKPNNVTQTNQVSAAIKSRLLRSRGGQADFTVLEQKQDLSIANSTLNTLTALISAVAAISLLVGGIGIMNMMYVSVMERTHEIGVRKAIGASNRQIFDQFLIESAIIGMMGGILGVILAVIADLVIRYFTSLQPAITFPIVAVSIGAALLAGVLFGAMPALRAAHKDPIDLKR